MTARAHRGRAEGRRPAGMSGVLPLLDWRDSSHWSERSKPCRYCRGLTHLRDSKHSPAHKTCAEQALAVQAAEASDAYQNGTL